CFIMSLFFFQAEDGIRDDLVTGVQTCALPISTTKSAALPAVNVLQEKLVAGFRAVVLEAESANALVDWLKDHGYAYSPEVEAWRSEERRVGKEGREWWGADGQRRVKKRSKKVV